MMLRFGTSQFNLTRGRSVQALRTAMVAAHKWTSTTLAQENLSPEEEADVLLAQRQSRTLRRIARADDSDLRSDTASDWDCKGCRTLLNSFTELLQSTTALEGTALRSLAAASGAGNPKTLLPDPETFCVNRAFYSTQG